VGSTVTLTPRGWWARWPRVEDREEGRRTPPKTPPAIDDYDKGGPGGQHQGDLQPGSWTPNVAEAMNPPERTP